MANPEIKPPEDTPKIVNQTKKPRGRISNAVQFPRNTLNDALEIPKAIWQQNAGEPFDPILLAQCVGTTHRSSKFTTLMTSSQRYGLTEGGEFAKAVKLSNLGKKIVAPTDENSIGSDLRQALMNPSIFEQIYSKYDRKNIPKEEIFKTVLERECNVARPYVQDCYEIIMSNINDYNLTINSGDSSLLFLDNLGKGAMPTQEEIDESSTDTGEQNLEVSPDDGEEDIPPKQKEIPKQIFVAHGKNKRPLEQLEKILNKFKVNYKIAIDEPHEGRPISAKVADLMKNSTSGIFIFTADEKITDQEGKEIWRPSQNVVYELGAASVLYGKKIVILKESDVSFASDFSDLGYISFEKDQLDAKAADLMLELINLGFMQLTPT